MPPWKSKNENKYLKVIKYIKKIAISTISKWYEATHVVYKNTSVRFLGKIRGIIDNPT